MENQIEKIYKNYKSVEARQAVDYINGLCEKIFYSGLLNREYPHEEVIEIIKCISDELEFAKTKKLTSTLSA